MIGTAKLEKLARRCQATSEVHTATIIDGWDDYSVVEKSLDKWLKAQEEYWEEKKRVMGL